MWTYLFLLFVWTVMVLFKQNLGESLSIDETSLSQGEHYTVNQ